jgi:hypothetical protein
MAPHPASECIKKIIEISEMKVLCIGCFGRDDTSVYRK